MWDTQRMRTVELNAAVRRAVFAEGISQREAARRFGLSRTTVAKMMQFSLPPGYRRSKRPRRPKLEPYLDIIDQILEDFRSRTHAVTAAEVQPEALPSSVA